MRLNFLDLPDELSRPEKAQVVVLGVPYEATTTYGKGTSLGPQAIIAASSQIEFYNEELDAEPCQIGIATDMSLTQFDPNPEKAVQQMSAACERWLSAKKMVVGLGGEHTVTVGLVRAFKKFYPDLWVLQLDAHSDLRTEYHESPLNHACVMARVQEMCPFVGVGIRSGIAGERTALKPRSALIYAHEMYSNRNWIETVLNKLGGPVYITIDLDFFDPAEVPAVGTPEPGGFHWVETLDFLRRVVQSRRVIGFDVVELSPKAGFAASDFFAAKLIYKLIGYVFADKLAKQNS
ncbi:MAG TPA: agmatinase [bacterium]